MNIVHINTSNKGSGGAIAAHRLHQGLITKGMNSRLLVGKADATNDEISILPSANKLEKLAFQLSWRSGLNFLNVINTFDIPNHPWVQEADVLNFHNLHGGYFNYLAIQKLTTHKPVIWTLHDMWSFTGHCVYSFDCDRWKKGCGRCPYPDTYPAVHRDSTVLEWKLKEWVYSRSDMVIVTLSQWLTKQAQASILNQFPIYHIPNGIDTDTYHPLDKALCRKALGIPEYKKVVMFGAQNLADSRKGGDLLLDALRTLPESLKTDIMLLTIGTVNPGMEKALDMEMMHLGYVESDRLKTMAYSAADVFVFPTRADNLPLVLQESMACGTPMVSFDIGGVPDLVRPGVTGYLARPEDAKDLGHGLTQLLDDQSLRAQMSQSCREISVNEYSLEQQAQHYIQLYKTHCSSWLTDKLVETVIPT